MTRFLPQPIIKIVPTQTVNIDEAKDRFFDLIAVASEGGEVIIAENGKALARIVPATDAATYGSHPSMPSEFSSDEDSLAWDADGWENLG